MKKVLSVMIAAILFAALLIPTASAADLYTSANDGDILYTANFNGDDFWKPEKTKGEMKVTVDPADSGKCTFENTQDKIQAWWGGPVEGLPLNETSLYTVYWTVTREEKAAIGFYPDAKYGVYAAKYPDNEKLQKLADQEVSVTVTVKGTKNSVDALKALGATPAEGIFVGDSGIDAETGRNAGMKTVLVAWGYRDEEELRTYPAAGIIRRPEELLAYL